MCRSSFACVHGCVSEQPRDERWRFKVCQCALLLKVLELLERDRFGEAQGKWLVMMQEG